MHLHKQNRYAVRMNCMATMYFNCSQNFFAALRLCCLAGALNCACVTTTTPVDNSGWLTKPDDSAAVKQKQTLADSQKSQVQLQDSSLQVVKPWDVPTAPATSSVLMPPNAQQMKEYVTGATWIKLEENGMRRRSLQLNMDGTFVARSDAQSGELPAFVGLKVQAKGTWSVKENELRLLSNAGAAVVVQLQWIGDKRIMMLDGESWIRGE